MAVGIRINVWSDEHVLDALAADCHRFIFAVGVVDDQAMVWGEATIACAIFFGDGPLRTVFFVLALQCIIARVDGGG